MPSYPARSRSTSPGAPLPTAYVEQIRTTIAGAQALGGDGPAWFPHDVRAAG